MTAKMLDQFVRRHTCPHLPADRLYRRGTPGEARVCAFRSGVASSGKSGRAPMRKRSKGRLALRGRFVWFEPPRLVSGFVKTGLSSVRTQDFAGVSGARALAWPFEAWMPPRCRVVAVVRPGRRCQQRNNVLGRGQEELALVIAAVMPS